MSNNKYKTPITGEIYSKCLKQENDISEEIAKILKGIYPLDTIDRIKTKVIEKLENFDNSILLLSKSIDEDLFSEKEKEIYRRKKENIQISFKNLTKRLEDCISMMKKKNDTSLDSKKAYSLFGNNIHNLQQENQSWKSVLRLSNEIEANAAGINEEVQASIYQFEDSKLQFETMSTSIIISKANNNKKKITPKTPKKKDTILSRTSNVASYQFIPKKKLRIHKACECQTDLTEKNIEALELLSKECSHQLSITQKDKENMQQLYEDTIDALTAQIEDNKNTIASLREEKSSLNQSTSVDPLSLLLPEMIPPEQTYKIFMHCVKHFKYEEDIYKKFMEEADLKNLKHFVTKMEKYIIGTSMPFKKTDNKKAQIASVPNKSNQRKANNNVLTGIRPYNRVSSHIPYNSFGSIPSEKRNNSTFSKYKAAISSYKKSVKY